MQNNGGQKPDQQTADAASEQKIGQIVYQTASENQHCNQNLSEVMGKTAADTDAGSAENAEMFHEQHHKKAENGSGKTVEKHGKVAEGKCSQQNANQRDACCRKKTEPVKRNNDNEVCKPQLDSRNHTFQGVRKKGFQPAKDKGKGNENTVICDCVCAGGMHRHNLPFCIL